MATPDDPTRAEVPWEQGRTDAARRFAERVVDDTTEGLLVDGEQVEPYRPEPTGDDEWPRRL